MRQPPQDRNCGWFWGRCRDGEDDGFRVGGAPVCRARRCDYGVFGKEDIVVLLLRLFLEQEAKGIVLEALLVQLSRAADDNIP